MSLLYKEISSSVGRLKLFAAADILVGVLWECERPNRVKLGRTTHDPLHPTLLQAEHQLAEYLSGERTEFDIAIQAAGTAFEQRVWRALMTIPYGETRSYRAIAEAIGSPAAVRAVGAAIGRNPLSIIIPCHRVIGSNGALTGFAGGIDIKAALLALEARLTGKDPDLFIRINPSSTQQRNTGTASTENFN